MSEHEYDPLPYWPDAVLFVGGGWDGGWDVSNSPNITGNEYACQSPVYGFMRYQKSEATGEWLYVGDK